MKLVETIKSLFAKLNEYTSAAKDIEKRIAETLNGKEKEEEVDEEDEEEEEEAPKKVVKKKKVNKKKQNGLK
jgi:hypothetical protein